MTKNEELGEFRRWPQLKKEVPLSRVTVWRWAREGKFPKPVTLGPNCSGWLRSEIEAWKRSRLADRDAQVRQFGQPDRLTRQAIRQSAQALG
jgi:prophage regulatory protein